MPLITGDAAGNYRLDELLTARELAQLLGYNDPTATITHATRGARVKHNLRWIMVGRQCAYLLDDAEAAGLQFRGDEQFAHRWLDIRKQITAERSMAPGLDPSAGSWLTTKQVAAYLGISRQYVHQLADLHGGPIRMIRFGYDYLWYLPDVEALDADRNN
jgi:excisionase family DNA binding protein